MGKLGFRIFGLGAVALGLIGLIVGDFALQWQPVPKDLPGRMALAYLAAAALALAGAAVFVRRSAKPAIWTDSSASCKRRCISWRDRWRCSRPTRRRGR